MTLTDSQINEFKKNVSELFMDKFYEFIDDVKDTNGEGKDFGWKYGFTIRPEFVEKWTKNTVANASKFASQVFNGGTMDFWTKNGFTKESIWSLVRDGFLSESTPWRSGSKTFYYIKQETVKDIFRKYKR